VNSQEPSFAVVVPVYNDGSHLLETVASVLGQQSKHAVQAIVVDDGSTELSADVLDAVSASGAAVVTNPRNEGPSAARNLGACEADAEWLVFLDADSQLRPDSLSLFSRAVDTRTGLVRARFSWVESPGTTAGDLFLPGTFAVRRAVFDAVSGYDAELRFAENTDLLWRLTSQMTCAGLHETVIAESTVLLRSVGKARNYDAFRMSAGIRMLEKHQERFADARDERARYEAIVAVNSMRTGKWRVARRYAWRAVRSDPLNLRHFARALVTLPGPVTSRRWRRQT
jgi:glycosyltransferase involved in cell wall biosynthesis